MGRLVRIGWLVAAALVVGWTSVGAQPAPAPGARAGLGAGGGRNLAGRAMHFLYLERAWTVVCFDLQITDEQLLKLRPLFQAAWESRKKAVENTQGGDLAGRALALSQANDQIRKDIDDGLAQVLTEDQLAQWEEVRDAPMFGGFGLGPGMTRPPTVAPPPAQP